VAKRLWAGLDVGVETTAVCVIGDDSRIVHQASCPTDVNKIHRELRCMRRRRFARVGLEASGGMALARGLRSLGYDVDLYEQRQLSKFLQVRRNKTDAGDAFGIAEAGRVGATVSMVYLKNLECQLLQSRLTIRRHLVRQRVSAVNVLGRQLEVFGGRLRRGDLRRLRSNVEREIRKLFGKNPNEVIPHLRYLIGRCEQLLEYEHSSERELRRAALENEVCRRFMEIPGVGPLCALTFYATIGDPGRFARSADVGTYLGLTPRVTESGLTARRGRISRLGPKSARTLLVTSGMIFIRSAHKNSDLWDWMRGVEERQGRRKAHVALARKLAIVMLAMWKNGTSYQPRMSVGEATEVHLTGPNPDSGCARSGAVDER
jgi:transposase